MSDLPRTQLSRAASQEDLLVGRKGGTLVCLKQPIWEVRELLVLVLGGEGARVRGARRRSVRLGDSGSRRVREVARIVGNKRERRMGRRCIFRGSKGRCRKRKRGREGTWENGQVYVLFAHNVVGCGTS